MYKVLQIEYMKHSGSHQSRIHPEICSKSNTLEDMFNKEKGELIKQTPTSIKYHRHLPNGMIVIGELKILKRNWRKVVKAVTYKGGRG